MLRADRRPIRRGGLVGLLIAVALGVGGPAGPAAGQSRSVSRAEAAAVARQAATDDEALRELRAVAEVDGQPVDLGAATQDVGQARAERLGALADALNGGARGPGAPLGSVGGADQRAAARRTAQEVLADAKYRQSDVPRPFKGALEWLADRLRPVGRFFGRIAAPILDLPGGALILGVLLVAAGAAAVSLLIARTSRAAVDRGRASLLVDPSLDPSDLDDRAIRAEADGDLTGSVRLRYQAGLLRLARTDRVVLRADTTAADAARQVGSAVMDRLTVDFEEIVYGDRTPTDADVARARDGWPEVLGVRSAR